LPVGIAEKPIEINQLLFAVVIYRIHFFATESIKKIFGGTEETYFAFCRFFF
jgi:hypothetical protein